MKNRELRKASEWYRQNQGLAFNFNSFSDRFASSGAIMGDFRPHYVLCEKAQGCHSPVCRIRCLVFMGYAAMMFITGNSWSMVWITAALERLFCVDTEVFDLSAVNSLCLAPRWERRRVTGCWCLWQCPTSSHCRKCHQDSSGTCCAFSAGPGSPLAQLGLTLTCTVLSPKAPGKDHAAVGIL